jgi:excisionase family DNA binding protein
MSDLTVAEVAEIMKVAPRTVNKWFDSGRLHGHRPDGLTRMIPRNNLVAFMRRYNFVIPEGLIDLTEQLRRTIHAFGWEYDREVPSQILLLRDQYERLREVSQQQVVHRVELVTLEGLAFEVFDSPEERDLRAVELIEQGKKPVVLGKSTPS